MAALKELEKNYVPSAVESGRYDFWVKNGVFAATPGSGRGRFCIVIPPPNITGSLHMGHALTITIEDLIVRWHRMLGKDTLWLPGTDHAGIATQMVVERQLREEGTSRHELGRERFLERVWKWKEQYGGRINEQLKVLGASLDWNREAFTLSAQLSRAVREAFVRLHEDGLIYRDYRLINWCPDCHTALSDLEVDHEENVKGELWSFAYPLADGSGEIVVATTRPETMLGDTAVAVHPEDERYAGIIGKKAKHPLLGYEFPIIGDAVLVDMAFGTGAVKVTPGHDFNDFATGRRHGLREINILNPDGTLSAACGKYADLEIMAARKVVKADLEAMGLGRGRKDHLMNIGRCQRCKRVVEPMLSTQWYVKTKPLAEPAIEAVERGLVKIIPENWTKTYFHWMRNIQDWCISRQLWWGHQIPAWYCMDCSGAKSEGDLGGLGMSGAVPVVAREKPVKCPKCGGSRLAQDPDVLDTWFSSGLWPFSTLGWPDDTADMRAYYPNDLMETGFDILFFWVARMMMLGVRLVHPNRPLEERIPFRTIYLHAMVRDEKGEKMSKTRGNVIDPLDVTAKHGADALRFTLASMAAQGHDVKLSMERVEGYRHFCNKLWNAARFVMMNLKDFDREAAPGGAPGLYDRWITALFDRTAAEVNGRLKDYRFDEAANAVYRFVWHEFCDWYLELAKLSLYAETDGARRARTQKTLVDALDGILRLLHPFMPFVTEEIWQAIRPCLPGCPPSLALARFPGSEDGFKPREDGGAGEAVATLKDLVTGVRNIRGEHGIEPSKRFGAFLHAADGRTEELALTLKDAAIKLGGLSRLEISAGAAQAPQGSIALHLPARGIDLTIPAGELINFEEEEARLRRDMDKFSAELEKLARRLDNPDFLEKAPASVIEKDTARRTELEKKIEKAGASLAALGRMRG
jgi:valyl-tRNA synthetase